MLAVIYLIALVALLGIGAFSVLAGAVVAVLSSPLDRPVELPPRPAGIALAAIGLLIFIQASCLVAGQIA